MLSFLKLETSEKGLLPVEEKIKAIHHYAATTDEASLRRFLGLASYYRRFVSDFNEKAAQLHRLLRKRPKCCWKKECEEAFEQLKAQLQSNPFLRFPCLNRVFVLCTDEKNAG